MNVFDEYHDLSCRVEPAARNGEKNDDIREIYYHIVGDTLVVDTLEEATRLDKKYRGKYPLCNYVGDCLERNGSITGGGRPARNRMRTDSLPISHQHDNRKQNDSKINAQMQSVAAQLANTEDQLRVVNEAIAECEPQIKYHVEQVAKLKKQIVFNEAAVKSLTESIADLELSSAVRPHHIECSEEELSTRKGVVAHMKKQLVDEQKIASQIKKDRDAGEVKARKMFDELVGKHKEQLRLTTERIEQMEADIARERAMLENNPAHITAVKKQLKDLGESYKVTSGVARQYSEVDSVVHNREEEENQEKLRVVSTDLKVALEDYTRVSNERVAADKKYQESLEVYRGMSANMEEINKMIDKAEGKIDHYENLLEEVANGWLTAESLDPSAKYCRTWEDDFQEKVNDGYLIMPEEVDADIIDYRSLYESTPVTVQAPGNIQQLKGMLHNLEVTAENFRIQHDEKGITHYATLVSLQLNELTSASKYVDKLHKHRVKLHDLKMARYEEFSQALSFLGTTTQMLYQLITNGGDASLKFVEEGRSMDPFSGGIKFSVRPATKSWKLIENLSGGEKTLASLCFVFAMHHFRATPLYVMDEIDAALDLNNVRLIANYIKNSERTRNAQFVIISLRNQMFEVGNRLIGIYKTDGSTKHVIINPDKIDEINKGARKTLDNELKELMRKKKREERRARGEEDPEDEEEQLAHSMQRVSLANKRHC
uniref:SMC_N domain-containing protein n=1 Tax=Caenorhabditis tropicalis TaxID=1561998 RepID=A0A1I7TQU0_9PELO